MKYFAGITTMEELKKAYKRLAKKYHPDLNDQNTTAIMAEINTEYERMVEIFQMGGATNANAFDGFREFIMKLLKVLEDVEDVTVEICGSWVWVTGNTKPHKDKLNKTTGVGMQYASKKRAWYWYEGEYVKKSRKNYNMEEIREMHGSHVIKEQKALTA